MPSSHKEKKGKHVKKEEDGPEYFAEQLAEMKKLKFAYEKLKSDRVENETILFGQETSFINDFDAYQEAAVAAGFIKEKDKIIIGRRFSESSSSWLQAVRKNPLLALNIETTSELPVKEDEDETETTKSHKKPADKNRKRKR
ncbi:hypothetical protein PRIPAC_73723 [Pristionchus pacificus]|uniref:Uncharacterized protein n=1 Tax=Pristionchus pacificus TaxID=54126 RepID=A0A2A6CG00_PRIPA|nr:hypothetical protein PRIPAC_73723 [Pristionchus pacificus]|eukprot:PDM77036.1 hypothetical protein PRIPAC_42431 [Pristionchus pacificus]